MRDLIRNRVPFWYSVYEGKDPIVKDGFDTGQYQEKYSEPVRAWAQISPATGDSSTEMFGASVSYDRVISTVQQLPINEYSRLWIDTDPTTGGQWDYRVKRVAMGLTNNLWAIEKVTRNG